jgi:predicted O-linked N-acetylglucosamine transferase (SPINDLY family)
MALVEQRQYATAMQRLDSALKIDPGHMRSLVTMSFVFLQTGNPLAAEKICRMGLRLFPGNTHLLNNLGSACSHAGKVKEAFDAYLQVVKQGNPTSTIISNLLLAANYVSFAPADIFEMHATFGQMLEPEVLPFRPPRVRHEKIRVGLVSADFRTHSCAFFLLSLLQHYDHEKFEFHLFSCTPEHGQDESTKIFQSLGTWHDILNLSDEEAETLIRAQEIEALIDCTGYMAGSRIPLFGLRPAPVQLTWLGYPNTTGLRSMDYRITDWVSDPNGAEKYYSERLLRLPGPFSCYTPPQPLPEVAPPPKDAPFMFGSFNNATKISDDTLWLWSECLKRVPESRLMVKDRNLDSNAMKDLLRERFVQKGISADRLEFLAFVQNGGEHLRCYNHVHLALDTVPYNGTTTTLEAALMGVPTVCLLGNSHVSRVGASLNTRLGLDAFIAQTPQEYIELAARHAKNKNRLYETKSKLRAHLLASPLCDAQGWAKDFCEAVASVL